MKPSRVVYNSLSAVIYPMFLAKIKKTEGLENLPRRGGFLIAANHVDWLDGFYIAAAVGEYLNRPVYFLTKTNNYWWTTLTIQIPTSARGTIVDTAVKQVTKGKIICNFPEGVRNDNKTLVPGKTGTARIAMMAGVPIIPLGISCDSGRTMAQSLLYALSAQHPVTLRVGPPLTFSRQRVDPAPADVRTATAAIMRAIAPLAGKSFSS